MEEYLKAMIGRIDTERNALTGPIHTSIIAKITNV